MTKADIVEALRCAADLCSRRYKSPLLSVSDAEYWLGVPYGAIRSAALRSLRRLVDPYSVESIRHDLLEAAQRIEESE